MSEVAGGWGNLTRHYNDSLNLFRTGFSGHDGRCLEPGIATIKRYAPFVDDIAELIRRGVMAPNTRVPFGSGLPSPELFPLARWARSMGSRPEQSVTSGHGPMPVLG